MEASDRRLLSQIQEDFPLTRRPFLKLARRLDWSEAELLARISSLKQAGFVRRLGAVFDLQGLGYVGTLCALNVPPERLEAVAEMINSFPGVTHNYGRDHEQYNLWFTLAAPTREELVHTLETIKRRAGIDEVLDLPAERRFKIRVRFDLDRIGAYRGDSRPQERLAPEAIPDRDACSPKVVRPLSEEEKLLVRHFQGDLPLVERPFLQAASSLGMTEERVLAGLVGLQRQGILRRFGAVIDQRRLGLAANALIVWQVPEAEVDAAGRRLAAFAEVTHCYQRRPAPNWSYNLYTVIHGPTRRECERLAQELARALGYRYPYRLLFSTVAFKRESPRYF
ncbi:MAG: AsnC family transcriptional regulator [Moorellales bacterium]